jgi:starch phosphorylase
MTLEPNASNPHGTSLPERLTRLPELAGDLWWTWNPGAREVFRRLDYSLWRQTAHNPVLMLRQVSPELLEQAARDERFLEIFEAALDALDRARRADDTWWKKRFPDSRGPLGYFSAEFESRRRQPRECSR